MSKLVIAARDAIPKQYRPLLQELYYSLVSIPYLGNTRVCPCCGWNFRMFKRHSPSHLTNAEHLLCPHCRSIGRHRWIWLYLKEHTDIENARLRILHFAQEYCLYRAFKHRPKIHAIGTDLRRQERVGVQEDIMRLAFAESTFDAIICNHVLEHVPDDHAAMRELYRVLRPDGWALVTTPVRMNQPTYEDASIIEPKQRVKEFGQWDHVRWYGCDLVDRLQAVGFIVTTAYANEVMLAMREKYSIDEADTIFFCKKPV